MRANQVIGSHYLRSKLYKIYKFKTLEKWQR